MQEARDHRPRDHGDDGPRDDGQQDLERAAEEGTDGRGDRRGGANTVHGCYLRAGLRRSHRVVSGLLLCVNVRLWVCAGGSATAIVGSVTPGPGRRLVRSDRQRCARRVDGDAQDGPAPGPPRDRHYPLVACPSPRVLPSFSTVLWCWIAGQRGRRLGPGRGGERSVGHDDGGNVTVAARDPHGGRLVVRGRERRRVGGDRGGGSNV